MFEDDDIHDLSFIRESLKIIVHRKVRSEEFGAKKVQELIPGISTMFAGARNQGHQGHQGQQGQQQRGLGRGQGPYNPAARPSGGLRRKQCSFCDGPHFSDSCTKYTTIDARMKVLRDSERCFQCCKRSHNSYNCPNK